MALEFAPSPPHPLACGETLPPQVEKGKPLRKRLYQSRGAMNYVPSHLLPRSTIYVPRSSFTKTSHSPAKLHHQAKCARPAAGR